LSGFEEIEEDHICLHQKLPLPKRKLVLIKTVEHDGEMKMNTTGDVYAEIRLPPSSHSYSNTDA